MPCRISSSNHLQVNSEICTWRSFPDQETMGATIMPAQSASYSSLTSANSRHGSHNLHRPSLPILQTRSTYPPELGSDYNPSPVDYTYASSGYPRQDSFSSSYGLKNYRSWSTTAPMTGPITTSTYDPQTGFTFGSISSHSMPYSQADSFSALNMGHLNASLPGSMVHDRRLPIPYVQQEPSQMPFSTGELPELRPLDRYPGPRSHVNGIHSRQALPWVDTTYTTTSSSMPMTTYAPISGLPTQTTDTQSDPAFGYSFRLMPPMTTNSSPEVSPTTGPNSSGSFQSTSSSSTNSMLPPAQVHYSSASIHGLPSITTDNRPSSSRGPSSALYDCNGERTDTQANDTNDRSSISSNNAWPSRSSAPNYSYTTYPSIVRAVDCEPGYSRDNSYNYPPLRQPQPQNPAGVMPFCRQPSYGQLASILEPQSQPQQQQQQDQQQHAPRSRQERRERHEGQGRRQSSGTARGRMSIENINAPY